MDNSGMATGGKMEVKPPIVRNRLPSKHSPGDARSLTTEMHPNHFNISFSLLFSVLPLSLFLSLSELLYSPGT